MYHTTISLCGSLSRILSRLTGGRPGQTLCARIAARFGHDCIFCRLIGRALHDPDHCWRERVNDLRKQSTTRRYRWTSLERRCR